MREKVIYLTFFAMVLGVLLVGGLKSSEAGVRLKLITDLGLVALDWFGFLVALVVCQSLVPPDLEGRGIYFPLSRPLTRTRYVLGKWLAILVLVSANVILLGALLQATIITQGGVLDLNLAKGLFCGLLKAGLFTALLILFSTFLTPLVSMFSGILAWVMMNSLDLVTAAVTSTGIGLFDRIAKFVMMLVPDFSHFSVDYVIVHHHSIPLWFIGLLLFYSVSYTLFFLLLAAWVLEVRDL